MDTTRHVPVLEREVLEYIQASHGGTFLDCTLGGGGHTEAMLKAHPESTVFAIDRDTRALARAKERLISYGERFQAFHGTFEDVEQVGKGVEFDGVLADLGTSVDQLFEGRGFSFRDDGPLDMRMDETQEFCASDIVNEYSESDLRSVLRDGGVGQDTQRVVKAIITARPIETTKELARIVEEALPRRAREKATHPATVVFQALRVAVNNEISQVETLLKATPRLIRSGGRLLFISFHSLEDKLVTRTMRKWEGERAPAVWPGAHDRQSLGKLLTRKAVVPSDEEVKRNPKSRSARLRVFEFAKE